MALPGYTYAGVGSSYASWINQFIAYLQSYHDVLIWGPSWGLQNPAPSPQNTSTWNVFWANALPSILATVQQYPYTSPPGRALLMVYSGFAGIWPTDVQAILSGYQWPWMATQQGAYYWTQYVPAAPPDLYAFGMYNANAADMEANLGCVAGQANSAVCNTPTCSTCTAIPYSKMFVTELATGSSFAGSPIGNGLAYFGDDQTPTSTAAGQAQWLSDTQCVLNRHGIAATGWYGLYDSASWWEKYTSYTGDQIAWQGYFGLSSEYSTYGNKPAWNSMLGYPGSCPSGSLPPAPVLALYTDAAYYTNGDPATITYTAADVTSLSLSEPPSGGVYSCETTTEISTGSTLVGSCAAANVTMSYQTSQLTLSGSDTDVLGVLGHSPTNGSASVSVTVGPSPIVTGIVEYNNGQSCNFIQNPSCTITASRGDIVEIYGEGFTPLGGNTVNLLVPGGGSPGPWWLYSGDGYYFWDGNRTQINAQIGCYVPVAMWKFDVWNPHQQAPSSSYSINIVNGSTCQ
ncbi:MAG: hypothetical protein ACLP59_20235 [Bryobacteraceae bacterium]